MSQGEDLVCLCFVGDAAINQGQFHEALNMAQIWKLPVLFLIENNLYGMGTAISRTSAVKNLADRAKGYDMKQAVVDGRNVINTYTQMTALIDEVRASSEPVLVEVQTYRFRGHSMSDPGHYRTKEEIETERTKDCLLILKQELEKQKLASESDFELWEADVETIVNDAVEFAEDSPDPELSEIFTDVLAQETAQGVMP